MIRQVLGFITGATLLAACGGGGGGGGGSGIDPRLARLDVYEAQKIRVLGDPGAGAMGMAPTPDAAMPETGSAVFDGSASIRVEAGDNPLVLFGDASVTVGFGDATVTGSMDNFFGTTSGGDVADYAGTITIDGGTLGGTGANAVTLDYAGALSSPGDDLALEGTMTGEFLGDPVGAMTAADLEVGITRNAVTVDGTLVLITETTGVVTP